MTKKNHMKAIELSFLERGGGEKKRGKGEKEGRKEERRGGGRRERRGEHSKT